jgi:hypothetical protein
LLELEQIFARPDCVDVIGPPRRVLRDVEAERRVERAHLEADTRALHADLEAVDPRFEIVFQRHRDRLAETEPLDRRAG